jgi:hypothetical protein
LRDAGIRLPGKCSDIADGQVYAGVRGVRRISYREDLNT